MTKEIVAEYRRGDKIVLLERLVDGVTESGYRLTVAHTLKSPDRARAAFLAEIPPKLYPTFDKQISKAIDRNATNKPL